MLRELRKATNMSLRDLANRAKISATYLSRIERGEATPSHEVVMKLARALDLRPEEIASAAAMQRNQRTYEQLGDHLVRHSMSYLCEIATIESSAAGRDTVEMTITSSYELFNPASEQIAYEDLSELSKPDKDVGPLAAEYRSLAVRVGDGPIEKLDPTRYLSEGAFQELRLVREVPAHSRLWVQVQFYLVEFLPYHRAWWATKPTEDLSVVVHHSPDLVVKVRPNHPSGGKFRHVLHSSQIEWYAMDDLVQPNQGIDLSWAYA